MLMQSHEWDIYVLPVFSDAWPSGSVDGLVARGGFKVEMESKDKKITKLVIHSEIGGDYRIRLNQQVKNKKLKIASGENRNELNYFARIKEPITTAPELDAYIPETWMYDFKTAPGKTYTIIDKKEN
jgi:alpha-L-fucosidase 2